MESGEVELTRRQGASGAAVITGFALALAAAAGCGERAAERAAGEPSLASAGLAEVRALLAPGGGLRVVNLWATWCKPCVDELPELLALDAAARGRGVRVIGVSLDLSVPGERAAVEERVRSFLRQRGVRYDNLLYTGNVSSLLDALDLPGPIPYTLVVGDDGEVLWRHEGATTRERIEAALEAARRAP